MNKELMFSSKSNEYSTPQDFFEELNKEFKFTLDPCCTKENAKCSKFYTMQENGLLQDWKSEVVFCNPPYSKVKEWAKKCLEESKHAKVVMLVPSRTDTRWFHYYVYKKAELRFVKGRLKFGNSEIDKYIYLFGDVEEA